MFFKTLLHAMYRHILLNTVQKERFDPMFRGWHPTHPHVYDLARLGSWVPRLPALRLAVRVTGEQRIAVAGVAHHHAAH